MARSAIDRRRGRARGCPARRAAGREPSRRSDSSAIGVSAEEGREPRVVADERAVGAPGRLGELVEDRRRRASRRPSRASCSGRGRDEDRVGHLLEVPPRDVRVGVVRRDDLALLGELQAAVDRSWRLAEDRPVRRPAATADGAAAAVEQRQLDAVPARATSASAALGPVEHPGRREEPRLLVRVGVAEHHLLAVAAAREVRAIARVGRAARRGSARPRVERIGTTRTAARHRATGGPVRRRRRGAASSSTSSTSARRGVKLIT